MLTDKQEITATEIFRKIDLEKNSDYIFSEDLQRIYLVELLHLIMKVYQESNPCKGYCHN